MQRVEAAGLAGAGRAGDEEMRHAREIRPHGGAGDVLPEPDRDGARGRRERLEDVAERDEVRREVRQLDADGLLAGDRREDADLGRRERVREVVLERGDLRDLRPRRELQLVARDARAGDLADDVRLDPEVLERLDEELGDARGRLAGVVGLLGRPVEDAGDPGACRRRSPRSPRRRAARSSTTSGAGLGLEERRRRERVRRRARRRRPGTTRRRRPAACGRRGSCEVVTLSSR